MVDPVCPTKPFLPPVVEQVLPDETDPVASLVVRKVLLATGTEIIYDQHLIPCRDKGVDDVRTYETGTARYDTEHCTVIPL
jgi:hypothetical protein